MSRKQVLTLLVLTLLVLSGVRAGPKKQRRMCIRQRIEWDGLLLGSDHEELLAMTVADL
jgi:hypothetical protein